MAGLGINTVRTYTPPRRDLLDEAARQGLRVMVGLPWSQHVAFLDDRRLRAKYPAGDRPAGWCSSPITRRRSPLPSATRFRPASSAGTVA